MKFTATLLTLILFATVLGAPVASAGHCGPEPLADEVVCITFEWYGIALDLASALLAIDWVALTFALVGVALDITFDLTGPYLTLAFGLAGAAIGITFALLAIDWVGLALAVTFALVAVGLDIALCAVAEKPLLQAGDCV